MTTVLTKDQGPVLDTDGNPTGVLAPFRYTVHGTPAEVARLGVKHGFVVCDGGVVVPWGNVAAIVEGGLTG